MMRRILALISLMGAVVFGQVPVGTEIINVAQSSHQDGSETTFVGNSNAVSTFVSAGYQLEISKTAGASVIAPGERLTYTITLTNTGNISPGAFSITDTLSADLELLSSSPHADVAGQIVTWNVAAIEPGQTLEYQLEARAEVGLSSNDIISNTAWVSVTDGFKLSTSPVDVTIGALSDLVLRKEVAEDASAISDTLHYTITLTNSGNIPSTSTIVRDELPEHVDFASASHGGALSNGMITWMLGELAEGDSTSLSLALVVNESMPSNTVLINTASAVNAQGVSKQATASSLANPWIQTINKWAADLEYGFEDTVEFVITIDNMSQNPVHTINVRDTLPEPLQFVSASPDGYTLEGGVVSWDLGTLNAGNVKTLTIVTTVGSLLEARPEITNRAWINTANAGSSYNDHIVSLAAFPELSLEKHAASSILAGDSLVYTFIMSNSGNSMAHDVVLKDTLPAYVTFSSTTRDYVYDEASHSILWSLNEIAVGATDTLKLTTHVDYPVVDGTSFLNTAHLVCVEGSNAQSSVMTEIQSAPGLYLEIFGQSSTMAGDSVDYELEYGNRGTEIATAVVLRDTLPGEVLYLNASPTHSYDPSLHVITWNLEDLAPGDSATVSVSTQVKEDQILAAIARSGGLISCEQGTQAISQHELAVRAPILDIDLVGDTTFIEAGEFISYDIVFQNVGDTTATNVVVVDSLPHNAVFLSATGDGVYDSTSHSVTWLIGNLKPVTQSSGAESISGDRIFALGSLKAEEIAPTELTVDVRVKSPLPNGTNLLNRAYITCNEELITEATWLSIVRAAPDFVFTKTAPLEVMPGDTIDYQLDYSNNGNDHATGVSIIDTLDSRLAFVRASGSYAYDEITRVISWDIGNINVGDEGRFFITTTVDDKLAHKAQVSNRAWLVSSEIAPQPTEALTTNMLPLSMVLEATPDKILGNGLASSTLAAHVYTFLGNPVPNGIDVYFFTDLGTVADSVYKSKTVDGIAYSELVSDTVLHKSEVATPLARALFSETEWVEDTTEVLFMIGAFDGVIADQTGIPQEGIRVELRHIANDEYVGHDSTNADGYYLIPIHEEGNYKITYTLFDNNGQPFNTVQELEIESPTEGSLVTNLNSVSGWVTDEASSSVIAEDSILIIISSELDSLGLGKITDHHFADSTYTDSTGRFFFTNLLPANYKLEVIYNGVSSYSDGAIDVSLQQPGLYVVNANIVLRSLPFYIYKKVDKSEAAIGDTLHYSIHFGPQEGIAYNDTVHVIDYLPAGVELIEGSVKKDLSITQVGLNKISNILSFSRNNIQAGDSLVIEFDARLTSAAGSGLVENVALLTNSVDSLWSYRNAESEATTKIIIPFLEVTKKSNRRVIEIGDVITYTLQISNKSSDDIIHDFIVEDLLPYGFKYRKNTSYVNGSKISDPTVAEGMNKRLAMTWTMGDTLQPGSSLEVKYRIIAGLNSKEGINTNEVVAYASTLQGFHLASDLATADVVVKPGLFSDKGLIIGKVYFDTNGNTIHDNGEETVKGVELIMENGARITTDEYGKYSIPSIDAGMHVIRVNENTLPELSEVILDSPDYMGDTQSKMVRVPAAGISKVNFALRRIATPGTITGHVFYDMNENGIFDLSEDTESGIMMILNDTLLVKTDSLGKFSFTETPLGDLSLSVDESSLPSYGSLFSMDSTVDSTEQSSNLWNTTLFSGDSVNINIPLKKLEIISVLSKESTLEMKTEMLTEEFRLLVYKPWSMNIRAGFVSGSATLEESILGELKNVGDLMKWQKQINLDINGHTDNVGAFADNQALSEARAEAIRNYMVETMRIDSSRIMAAGHGDTLPLVSNDSPEGRALNRRVEMMFYNAQEEDSEFNQLEFMYNIDYSGEIPIQDIRFHHQLPSGFTYKTGTAKLDDKQQEPVEHKDENDIWDFGDWNAENHTTFDVAMKPHDYEKVKNTGIVSAYLEMVDVDGNVVVTDSLETRISTLIETLSFNMILEGTQFASGSADLAKSAYPSLRKLGKFLQWKPEIEIVIEGFTDDRGSLEFNMALSEYRAISVKNFLLRNYDVNPENIHVHGLGPHYPVGDNDKWRGRSANRRVEVLVNAELGEAALLELDMIKESLKQKFVIPIDPLRTMTPDSALTIPAEQNSTLLLNMSFPAYADADSIVIELALPQDLDYVDFGGKLSTWGQAIEEGSMEVTPAVRINAPEGIRGVKELNLNVQLFKDDLAISGLIKRMLKVNIEEPDPTNE